MKPEVIKKIAILIALLSISYLLFDFYHMDMKYKFVRITSKGELNVLLLGEVIPLCLMTAFVAIAARLIPSKG